MKHVVFLSTVAFLLVATGLTQAQEMSGMKGELHGVVDVTYQSKYIWRGFDVYADKSAVQASVDLDLFQTGFGISAVGHRANSSGFEAGERWDYTLYYQNTLFGDELYATNYRVGWVYYNYPQLATKVADLQEMHAILSCPKILQVKGLVPTYVLVKLWPSESGMAGGGLASGYAHIFMLDYALPMPSLFPDVPEQIFNLHSEVVYNDSVNPAFALPNAVRVDNDWSNAVFGVSTDFDLGYNITLTPGVYHQITMDNSVNADDDETWATLSAKYAF